jgi:hypothetical protein
VDPEFMIRTRLGPSPSDRLVNPVDPPADLRVYDHTFGRVKSNGVFKLRHRAACV